MEFSNSRCISPGLPVFQPKPPTGTRRPQLVSATAGAVCHSDRQPASPTKNGPNARCAEAIKVFILETARWSIGYPSGALIKPGKSGNVCPIVNRTRKVAELASGLRNHNMSTFGPLLGPGSVVQSRIPRFRGIVETNRRKWRPQRSVPKLGPFLIQMPAK